MDIYKKNIGSRAEVWHGTAKKTSGGLEKKDLKKNPHGYIVSKKKSLFMIKNPKKNPLNCYLQKKKSGKFGVVLECPNSPKKKTKRYTKSKKRSTLFQKLKQFF